MVAQDIRKFTRAQPFVPFRVTLSNGEEFDIRHPDMIMPAGFGLVYIAKSPKVEFVENVVHVSLDHLLKIEYLTEHAAPPLDKSTV